MTFKETHVRRWTKIEGLGIFFEQCREDITVC